jgi:hypothetical protein
MGFRQSFESALKRWSGRNATRLVRSAESDSGGDHIDTVTALDQEPRQSDSNLGITPQEQVLVEQAANGSTSPERLMGEPLAEPLYGPDICLPSEATIGRVKTHWDTVIFADVDSSTLRHGPEASSPSNVMLAENEGTAYLFRTGSNGERHTIVVAPEGLGSDDEPDSDRTSARTQAFDVSHAEFQERVGFGLRSGGLLLCAEGDGRVTLSRKVLGPWERFELTGVVGDARH